MTERDQFLGQPRNDAFRPAITPACLRQRQGLGHLLTVPVCRGEEGRNGGPRPAATHHRQPLCPRAPAAEPGTPGLTINRSGTENDQWLLTVYDYAGGWSPVCPIRSKLERDREQHGRQGSEVE